jgi:uncharacterized membrane protein (DUF373 family)
LRSPWLLQIEELEIVNVQHTHPTPRKYLEFTQDVIVLGLTLLLFLAMGIKLFHLIQLLLQGIDFSLLLADVLFILVLLELFRLLLLYLEKHRFSVATMVEVGIVSTLREVILTGALEIEWQKLSVVSAFILALGFVLRYATVRSSPKILVEEHGVENPQLRGSHKRSEG